MRQRTRAGRDAGMRTRWAVVAVAAAILGGSTVADAVDSTPTSFSAVTPVRVFDTRDGTGGIPIAPVGQGATLTVTIGGTNGLPAGVKAVALNVTVVNGTTQSFLTVWPTGDTQPLASTLNWTGAAPVANGISIGLGTAGKVSFFNAAGTVNVLADLVGYYGATPAGPVTLKGIVSRTPVNLPASGSNTYIIITSPFVAAADATCMVTSNVQAQPAANAPSENLFVRNAVSRNGTNFEDGYYGHYLQNDGTGNKQPSLSRTSVIAITAGQTIAFGVFVGGLTVGWYSTPFAVTTSYLCS